MTSDIQQPSDSQDSPAPSATPPKDSGGLFILLMVMLAVFPATLGISFSQSGSGAGPTGPKITDLAPIATPNDLPAPPQYHQLVLPDRDQGDELLRGGRYETALHLYRSLGNPDTLRGPPGLAVRIGLCQEALGMWEEALESFRSVADSSDRQLAAVAILAQARVWIRLDDVTAAEPLLRSLLLQSGHQPAFSDGLRAEAAMLYPIVLAEMSLSHPRKPTDDELSPVSNVLDWPLADSLNWADARLPKTTETPDDLNWSVTCEQSTVDGNPLQSAFSLVAARQPVSEILERLARETGLKLEWTGQTGSRAALREVKVETAKLPLNVIVSALCREIDAHWTFDSTSGTVQFADSQLAQQDRGNCRVALEGMMSIFRGHRLTDSATFARAQLAAADGRLEDSAKLYASLTRHTATPLAVRAALNASLAFRSTGDLAATCRQLLTVVHGGAGNEFHTRALILYGRTLIEQGQFHEAAFQLKRAAGSRRRVDEQGRAAVLQAAAELLDGRPQGAAESLFAHRMHFQDRRVRNAAALMTSLSRWRTVPNSEKHREAAFLYRSIVAVDSDSAWLGSAGQLLLGQAMHEADLDERMVEVYSRALEQDPPPVIAGLIQLELADYWYGQNRRDEAKAVWSQAYSEGGLNSPRAAWRLAAAALDDRQPDACLELCQGLRDQHVVSRAELLKLAGRAYDMSSRPVLAAQCYAGEWPIP